MDIVTFVKPFVPRPLVDACQGLIRNIPGPRKNRASRWYMHDLSNYKISEKFGFKTDVPTDNQMLIGQRLVDYYHYQKSEFRALGLSRNNDMWALICRGHQPFEAALEQRDLNRISEILLHACEGPLVDGFMNYTHFKKLVKSKARRNSEAKHFVDKLLALGEALGCMPVQCPEQGAWGYRDLDLDRMIHEIQQRLPMEVSPPKAGGGSFGLNTDFGTLCMKDIIAIYTAFRVHSLLAGARQKIVAEIGGGTGTLAYYLAKAGMDEVSVFDLPIISILQAYYLMKSLGPDQVWLYGEAIRPAAARLMPYWQFNNAPKDYFSLIANQDSLPEIEVSAAENYIQLIREKGNEFFLSLNQEAHAPNAGGVEQSIVYNLVEKNGGFERIYRFPHWMRAGYVEELYRIR